MTIMMMITILDWKLFSSAAAAAADDDKEMENPCRRRCRCPNLLLCFYF